MSSGVVTAAYIVAAILFYFSLAGLSKHETSKQGNLLLVLQGWLSRYLRLSLGLI